MCKRLVASGSQHNAGIFFAKGKQTSLKPVALFHIMGIMIMLCYTVALAKTEPPRTLKLTFIEPGSEIIEIFVLL